MPALAPHIQFRAIDHRQVLLVSETFNTLLRGTIHGDLLPLLDGRRSRADVAAALRGRHSESDVHRALVSLSSRGYVVSGEYAMEPGQAAFWSSLGASPRWAEERLGLARVAVAGDDGRLAGRLEAMGVTVRPGRATLSVVVCNDYLDHRHAALNQRHLTSGTPWMLARPKGMQPLFGPVFRPAEQGPCWDCLCYRMRGHQEVHNFLRNLGGDTAAFQPRAAEPAVLDAVCGLVAAEIAKWLVFDEAAPVHDRAVSLDLAGLKSEHHAVMRRPQCRACGDEALYRADRPAAPVTLRPSPKSVRNSGGVRSVSPEETLARYRHLVSPVSGVVTWVARTTDEADPWLHVYWAGSNVALRSRELSSLRRSLRSKSAGKGATRRQSEASALCEAVERYSGAFHGDEIRRPGRFADFAGAGASEATHPQRRAVVQRAGKLDDASGSTPAATRTTWFRPRLDPEAELDWSPVWSLTQRRHGTCPLHAVRHAGGAPGRADLIADSNGCAAGNTLEEAICRASSSWWNAMLSPSGYNRLRAPAVDLESFATSTWPPRASTTAAFHRHLWVLDVTGDLGIPSSWRSRGARTRRRRTSSTARARTPTRTSRRLRAVCEMISS